MIGSKGLKRLLVFVVFLVPVCWYFFLQLFGSNQFNVEVASEIPIDCNTFSDITIIHRLDSLNPARTNSLNRVSYRANTKKIVLLADTLNFFNCIQRQADIALVGEEGVWGTYNLDREGVDQLLTEIDILIIQKTYGKGLSR